MFSVSSMYKLYLNVVVPEGENLDGKISGDIFEETNSTRKFTKYQSY